MRLALDETADEGQPVQGSQRNDLYRFSLTSFMSRIQWSVLVERKFDRLFNK